MLASRGSLAEVCAPEGRSARVVPQEAPGLVKENLLRHCSWACRQGPVAGGPWYPGCHWTDSIPRASGPHAS